MTPLQKESSTVLLNLLRETLLVSALMIIVPVFLYLDLVVLNNEVSEHSITEFSQSILILSSSIIFARIALTNDTFKKVSIPIAGLFAAMFIREGDYFLDQVMDNLWKILVLLVAAFTIFSAYRAKGDFFGSVRIYTSLKAFPYLLIGFLVIVLFSRLFGTGNLWRAVMQENYSHVFKTAIQEGLELLGYVIVFLGSLKLKSELKRL